MSEVINDCKVCPRYLKTVCVKMCSYLRLLIVPSYQGCEVTGFVFLFRSNLVSPPVGPPLVILLLHFRAFSLSVSLCVCVCVCVHACVCALSTSVYMVPVAAHRGPWQSASLC